MGRLVGLALNLVLIGGLLWWWHPAFIFDRFDDTPSKQSPDSEAAVVIDADADHEHLDAVTCMRDDLGWMTAMIDITNRGDDRADYFAGVIFESANGDRQLGRGRLAVYSLEPGQVVTEGAPAHEDAPMEGSFRCRLVGFARE
jgi:hypothetical protein